MWEGGWLGEGVRKGGRYGECYILVVSTGSIASLITLSCSDEVSRLHYQHKDLNQDSHRL